MARSAGDRRAVFGGYQGKCGRAARLVGSSRLTRRRREARAIAARSMCDE
jgi:hypothetical protein